MHWSLPRGRQAAYLKLISLITRSIETGELLPGSQLPPERQLAQLLQINRSTVQHAFSELVSRGILVRKIGSGTWVNSGKWGVLSQGVNWQSYLTTGRLSDPDNYMVRMRKLEQTTTALNLSHSSIITALALPITLEDLPGHQLMEQESDVSISGSPNLKHQLTRILTPYLRQSAGNSQLLITSGAHQAFYLIVQGLLSYGDAIAIEEPSYFYQLSLFQAAGIRVFGIPLKKNGSLDLKTLRQIYYQHHLRFLFVNPTGQNPTGQTMTLTDRQLLVQCCQQLKLPIVEDDPLGITNAVTGDPVVALKALDPDNVLYIGSLSTLSGAHTRIGWLIAPPAVIERLADIRQQMEAGISIFPQIVAESLLSTPNLPEQINHQQQALREHQLQLQEALAPFVARQQLDYELPSHGSSLWVHLNIDHQLSVSDYNLFLDHQLLVRPDFLFGSHQNRIRISFTDFSNNDTQFLQQRLNTVLEQLE